MPRAGKVSVLTAIIGLSVAIGSGGSAIAQPTIPTTRAVSPLTASTRAAFVKAANGVCDAQTADLTAKFRALGYTSQPAPKSPEEVALKKKLAPLVMAYLTTTAAKISALPRASSDGAKIDRLVAVLREGSAKIKADYRTLDNVKLLDEANSIGRLLGLSACAA